MGIYKGDLTEGAFRLSGLKYLSKEKLRYFWNLKSSGFNPRSPRLVTVGKMQNPFKYEDSFTSFRDDSDELYKEIMTLQEELQKYRNK